MLQPSQLRYHWYVLGSREALKKHFRVTGATLAKILPEDNIDRFCRGQMIRVGNIVCKRCSACGTARELYRFWMDEYRKSGCRAVCDICRESGKKSQGYNEFQRRQDAAQSAFE